MKIYTALLAALLFSCTPKKTTTETPVKDSISDKSSVQTGDSVSTGAAADSPVAAIPANRLIVLGKSIGLTVIGEPTEKAMKHLGKPDAGDAAMGKSVSTWYSKNDPGYKTQVYSSTQFGSDGDRPVVKAIRITNPFFQAANGLKPGSSYKDININPLKLEI